MQMLRQLRAQLLICGLLLLLDYARSDSLQIDEVRYYILSAQKNVTKRQGWASVLFKRTFGSLRSFPFFIKERIDLCVLFRSL